MIQIDPGDIAKIATAFASFGAGFKAAAPFVDRWFTHWLSQRERADKIAEDKDRALERIAVHHERFVGVLERVDQRLDRLDARQDRVEAHLGIPMTASTIPVAAEHTAPRRALTDPTGERAASLPEAPSQPAHP